jgi:endo-1,4-beta-D-glucanase Y
MAYITFEAHRVTPEAFFTKNSLKRKNLMLLSLNIVNIAKIVIVLQQFKKNYINNKKTKKMRIKKLIKLSVVGLLLQLGNANAQSVVSEAENTTKSGPYAANITSPFSGIGLYANNDAGSANVILPKVPGEYNVSVIGASSNSSTASVSLEIDGTEVASFSFSGTNATTVTKRISFSGNATKGLKLILKTDNGSNDTFIDKVTFSYISVTTSQPGTVEAENTTKSGPYAGNITSPFNGIGLYGNNDAGSANITLPTMPGEYNVSVIGASSNSSTASVSLEIDGTEVASFSFSGTNASTQTKAISFSGNATKSFKLIMKTDNGSNDIFIDKIIFAYKGVLPPARTAPVIPGSGAVASGVYRNMFVEAGYSAADVTTKINNAFQQLFYGNDSSQRVYYPVGTDKAYILDTGNGDVRSEGMSYGMMICVQMNKKAEFDKIWNWANTYMRHTSGPRKGYFAWKCSTSGNQQDANPASDGEEYFATALLFASKRWGNGSGIYNYGSQANTILSDIQSKENPIVDSVTNMFNRTQNQVVFVPYASAAIFTDPSYHLPAFYEIWAVAANANRPFWSTVANTSRSFFSTTANGTTGLMPDYAKFNGQPQVEGGHESFRFDAWRCIMNMAVDYAWYKKADNERVLSMRMHNFFKGKGMTSYVNQYTLDGTSLSGDRSPGLIACNAVGALASNSVDAWGFIDQFYNTGIPSGQYRYYDGLLYMMSLLHVSGQFRAYIPSITAKQETAKTIVTESEEIAFYPNPAKNGNVSLKGLSTSQNYDVTVLNLNGQVVTSQKINNADSNNINLSNVAKGMYIVNIKNEITDKTVKLLVE